MSKLDDLLNEKQLSEVEEIIKDKMSDTYDLRKSFATYPSSFAKLFKAMWEGVPDGTGGTRELSTQEVVNAVQSIEQSDIDQSAYLDELFEQGKRRTLRKQFQDLKKVGFDTPEGKEIIKSINSLPAYADFVDQLIGILDRTTTEQCKYLDDRGRMYPAVLIFARQKVEETGFGQFIVTINSDRRLYAILKPTPGEDLHRIKVILKSARASMDPQEYEHFMQSLTGYHWAVRIAQKYDEGQVSYEAARDMVDEVFGPGPG